MTRPICTDQIFIEVVKNCTSIREVLIKTNLKPCGGNYQSFRNRIKRLNIDTSHFLGHGNNKGKIFGPKRPISDYLSNKHRIASYKLKKRLIADGYMKHQCSICGQSKWFGGPIPTELDHIDGDNQNNNISNLRILCPNCHALTDTYKGRNIKINRVKKAKTIREIKIIEPKQCIDCNVVISRKAERCKSCSAKLLNQKITKRPPKEQLELDIKELNNNMCAIGRKYNVSDNSVRKWIKHYEL